MGYRKGETREQYNARLNAIMKQRYIVRRKQAVEYLGGHCVDCFTTQMLEFDHKDPAQKSFNLGSKMTQRWEIVQAELDKCELRCVGCHAYRTACQKLAGTDILSSLMGP